MKYLLLAALLLCSCDSPRFYGDNLTVISKTEHFSSVLYVMDSPFDDTHTGAQLYIYSKDRSLDVGDHVKLVRK